MSVYHCHLALLSLNLSFTDPFTIAEPLLLFFYLTKFLNLHKNVFVNFQKVDDPIFLLIRDLQKKVFVDEHMKSQITKTFSY
jgi:hypothetical protein